jgi:AraC-like DNA-binding protein
MKNMESRHKSNDGLLRVGPLMAIPALLREFGHEPKDILATAGLKLSQFSDPDVEISYLALGKLLAQCVTTTGCEHFGLLVGERAVPSSLGVAGFMLQNAPDVASALRDFVQHIDLYDHGGTAVLQIQSQVARISYAVFIPEIEAAEQIYDAALGIGCNVMRSLCGDSWNPSEVLLPRTVPADIKPFRRFFRAPLRFNAEQAAMAFPASLLKQKVRGADDFLHLHLEREAARLHETRETNIVDELRVLLRKSILAGRCTVDDIAGRLCLHERTLNRRLHEQGTSFRREYENIRFELAQQLLVGTSMPIMKISTALNYCDASAFNHAFKRWTGETPARWRARSRAS